MRRDMDLIRRILIMVGDSPVPLQATVFVDDMHPFETVAYHIDLIGQADLADTSITRTGGGVIGWLDHHRRDQSARGQARVRHAHITNTHIDSLESHPFAVAFLIFRLGT